jgi:hypothetical protein
VIRELKCGNKKCGRLLARVSTNKDGTYKETVYYDFRREFGTGFLREGLFWAVCPSCGHKTPVESSLFE